MELAAHRVGGPGGGKAPSHKKATQMTAAAITQSLVVGSHAAGAQPYLLRIDALAASVITLPQVGVLLAGRGEEAEIRIEDAAVSRRHARFAVNAGVVTVTDLGSHNGTFVNGTRLADGRALSKGDDVQIGEAHLVLHQPEGILPVDVVPVEQQILGDRSVLLADPAMHRLYELIRRLGASDLPVLIGGETGVGKEHAARALHHASRRAQGPFVTLNCAGLQDTLVESELFGHERGAFTGAVQTKRGLLEVADGGTVFLDEVGELSPAAQAKLLRVLETRRLTRVGGTDERPVDIRVVAATHRDLEADVSAGRFRKDLFFRLGAATLALPPLRDRPRELPLLTDLFLRKACEDLGRSVPHLSPALRAALGRYGWPGNVRELKNAAEFLAAAVPDAVLEPHHLPERMIRALELQVSPALEAPAEVEGQAVPLSAELEALERRRIQEALEATGWVQTRAAKRLGIPLRTFTARLKKLGLRTPPGR
jgi:DNA-binding NtrC family response regulator